MSYGLGLEYISSELGYRRLFNGRLRMPTLLEFSPLKGSASDGRYKLRLSLLKLWLHLQIVQLLPGYATYFDLLVAHLGWQSRVRS
jgi:hypothetical protein